MEENTNTKKKKMIVRLPLIIILVIIIAVIIGIMFTKEKQETTQPQKTDQPITDDQADCDNCEHFPPSRGISDIERIEDHKEFAQQHDITFSETESSSFYRNFFQDNIISIFDQPFQELCGFQQKQLYKEHETVCLEDISIHDDSIHVSLWRDGEIEYTYIDIGIEHFRLEEESDLKDFYKAIPTPKDIIHVFDEGISEHHYFLIYNEFIIFFNAGFEQQTLGAIWAVIHFQHPNNDFMESELQSFAAVAKALFFSRLSPE